MCVQMSVREVRTQNDHMDACDACAQAAVIAWNAPFVSDRCTAELLNGFLRKRRALRNLCERCTMRDVDDGTHARARFVSFIQYARRCVG